MSSPTVFIDGKPYPLGQRIGKGGEGEIFLLPGDKTVAVKMYTLADLGERPEKVKALVQARLAANAPLVAFPIAEVRNQRGNVVGFTMRLMDGHKPLHELYAPGPRKTHFAQADYRFLVRTATNIAAAIASVHQQSCVIGDINHSSILISPKAMIGLIDADSFQIDVRAGRFLCRVGVPEYTPPELQGESFAGKLRTVNHDAFGLAVVIFQLLFMGRHPFVGIPRKGDIPPIPESIKAHRFVYSTTRSSGMDQPPGTPSLSDFSPALATAFDRAFLAEFATTRPTASEWVKTLSDLERNLVVCANNQLHHRPKGASSCAWCDMERQLGTTLFFPYVPGAAIAAGKDPGPVRFDLDGIWAQIQRVKNATNTRLSPKLPATNCTPSDAAKAIKNPVASGNPAGWVLAIVAVLGLVIAPPAFILWAGLFIWGVNLSTSKKKHASLTPFTTGYIASEQLFARELANWSKRNGVDDFAAKYAELEEARSSYELIRKDEERQIAALSEGRRTAQLSAFLDAFSLDQAKIKGIGPGKRAVLASFGIDTAADISLPKLLAIKGFGHASSQPLVDWRAKLEQRFVFRPAMTAADFAAIAKIREACEKKLSPLRATLSVGAENLSRLASRMQQIASKEDGVLAKAALMRDEAKCDLEYLGLPIPTVPPIHQPNTRGSSSFRQPSPVFPPQAPTTGSVLCPQCGQAMIRRQARRGRNAGGTFGVASGIPCVRERGISNLYLAVVWC